MVMIVTGTLIVPDVPAGHADRSRNRLESGSGVGVDAVLRQKLVLAAHPRPLGGQLPMHGAGDSLQNKQPIGEIDRNSVNDSRRRSG
jgi:hypothetical protein